MQPGDSVIQYYTVLQYNLYKSRLSAVSRQLNALSNTRRAEMHVFKQRLKSLNVNEID